MVKLKHDPRLYWLWNFVYFVETMLRTRWEWLLTTHLPHKVVHFESIWRLLKSWWIFQFRIWSTAWCVQFLLKLVQKLAETNDCDFIRIGVFAPQFYFIWSKLSMIYISCKSLRIIHRSIFFIFWFEYFALFNMKIFIKTSKID